MRRPSLQGATKPVVLGVRFTKRPDLKVRISGYAAIVDVSREQHKWVKRNADVLVQLLQSGESAEVSLPPVLACTPGSTPVFSFCPFRYVPVVGQKLFRWLLD